MHGIANKLERHHFPFKDSDIPFNGIYILFQKDEFGHDQERIVRIGTHTGDDRLCLRLEEHFLTENKDRSIFRKNIGRAILKKRNDQFLESWNYDLTTRAAKDLYSSNIDFTYQQKIEDEVSEFIKINFSFAAIPVVGKKERLEIESLLISTVSLCKQCGPSGHWLGKYSSKPKIAESGLWQIQKLYKTPFDDSNIKIILALTKCKL